MDESGQDLRRAVRWLDFWTRRFLIARRPLGHVGSLAACSSEYLDAWKIWKISEGVTFRLFGFDGQFLSLKNHAGSKSFQLHLLITIL
ncbi:unnamed protein product [Rhizophagus irregularis]|nr:unnamed protein product [Rhizophagus irregularis]